LRPPHDLYSIAIHSRVPKFVERILHATKLTGRSSKLVEALIKGGTLRGWQPFHAYLRLLEHVHEGGVIAHVIRGLRLLNPSYLRFTILSGGNIRDELAGDFFAATFKYGLFVAPFVAYSRGAASFQSLKTATITIS
jgi:hypothetical protein